MNCEPNSRTVTERRIAAGANSLAANDETPTWNLEAERSVLGAILIDNDVYAEAISIVQPQHFFRDAHQRTLRGMMRLADKHAPLDLVALKEELEKTGDLEKVGGPAYLASLVDGVPRSTNAGYYAQVVKDKADLRRVIAALSHAIESAPKKSLPEIVAGLDSLVRESAARSTVSTLRIVDETELSSITTGPAVIPGVISTGINFLVGAPGAGKTTLAYTIAVSVATGLPWNGIDIELPGRVVFIAGEGAGAAETRLRAAKINAGLDPDQPIGVQVIPQAVQLFDRGTAYAELRRYLHDDPAALVIIDTFSLMVGGADENNAAEMTEAIDAARQLGCPIAFNHHTDKSNKAERGSSAIKAAADGMLMLLKTDDESTLTVEKIRDGVESEPMQFRLVEVPASATAKAPAACSMRLSSKVQDVGELTKAQRQMLDVLWASFEGSAALRKEWMALTPTIVERTAYHSISRLRTLGFVTEDKGRFTPVRKAPPAVAKAPLQSAELFAMGPQGCLQGVPQQFRNSRQAENSSLQSPARPLQADLQGSPGGSLEPSGTLQSGPEEKSRKPRGGYARI